MKKHLIAVLVFAFVLCLVPIETFALDVIALSPQKLEVNGVYVDCEKYNINDSNYFKLRDIAYLLNGTDAQFEVSWDNYKRRVTITTGAEYTKAGGELALRGDMSATAIKSNQIIMINGERVSNLSVYNIGDNNFFKLRDLGEAIGFNVSYDAETNSSVITSVDSETVSDMPPKLISTQVSDELEKKSYKLTLANVYYKNKYTDSFVVSYGKPGDTKGTSKTYTLSQLKSGVTVSVKKDNLSDDYYFFASYSPALLKKYIAPPAITWYKKSQGVENTTFIAKLTNEDYQNYMNYDCYYLIYGDKSSRYYEVVTLKDLKDGYSFKVPNQYLKDGKVVYADYAVWYN